MFCLLFFFLLQVYNSHECLFSRIVKIRWGKINTNMMINAYYLQSSILKIGRASEFPRQLMFQWQPHGACDLPAPLLFSSLDLSYIIINLSISL